MNITMSNMQIKFSIKEIIYKFWRKLDNLSKQIEDIELRLTEVETKLNSELSASKQESEKIRGSQKAQIWTLIGGLITAMAGFLTVVGRFIFSQL